MFGSSRAAQAPKRRSFSFLILWSLLWLALGLWLARHVNIVVGITQ